LGRAWQDLKRESIQQAVIRLMCREGLKSVILVQGVRGGRVLAIGRS